MRTEISYSPAFAMATVHLDDGESVKAEAGAMMAMSPASRSRPARRAGCSRASSARCSGASPSS